MNIVLPKNHHSLTFEYEMQTLCKPLFEKTDVVFFCQIRAFDDGNYSFFFQNNNVMRYLLDNKLPFITPFPKEVVNKNFSYFVPTDGPYQRVMHDIRSFFNLEHALDFVETRDGYIDMFCFCGEKNNSNMINVYLNNIDYFKNFIKEFKGKTKKLEGQLNKQKILFPSTMHTNLNSKGIIYAPVISKKNALTINGKDILLTKREWECLNKLPLGYNAKEIGELLTLSPRTVEDHIQRAKKKLGYPSRSEIVRLFKQ